MSAALKNLEKMACENNITDHNRIGSILSDFLNMKNNKLVDPKGGKSPYYSYLIRDIAKGFKLDPKKIPECSTSELLTLIGCEPGVPWYAINKEEETWYVENKLTTEFCSAGHSFALAQALLRAQIYEPLVKRFMKINHRELIQYLANRINEADDMTEPKYTRLCRKKGMRLNRTYYLTQKFMHDHSSLQQSEDPDNTITVGEIITRACQVGCCAWVCGNEPLGVYVDRVSTSYMIMNYIFMTGLREIAISTGSIRIKRMLDRLSESGRYDHFPQIDLEEGFKSLIVPEDEPDYIYLKYDKQDVKLMEEMVSKILS